MCWTIYWYVDHRNKKMDRPGCGVKPGSNYVLRSCESRGSKWLIRKGRKSYSGGELRPIIINSKMVGVRATIVVKLCHKFIIFLDYDIEKPVNKASCVI